VHEISVFRHFYASHQLRQYTRDAGPPHRHRWEVRATAFTPELGPEGFGLDFETLDAWLEETLDRLDGQVLNELEPFRAMSPSAENLSRWIYQQLAPRFPSGSARLGRVEVFEGSRYSAAYWEGWPGESAAGRGGRG